MAGDIPDELYADPGRLRQVLINLLSNAVKFAAAGEVRVTAKTQLAGGNTQLRLTVRDRGPVIPEEDRSRLFQPFSRIEQAGAEGTAGTGLGLAICRHLVTMMGGEIGCDVWTMVDREAGNEFWIVLPVTAPPSWSTPCQPGRCASKAAPAPHAHSAGRRHRGQSARDCNAAAP